MKTKLYILSLITALFLSSCNVYNIESATRASITAEQMVARATASETDRFIRDDDEIDFSGIIFNRWDVEEASAGLSPREMKPYTIMIYMNGSDLESEEGAATVDLQEILDSGIMSDYANIIVFTGGANRWQNSFIPENECVIWEIRDGRVYKITGVGLVNMGDAGTLSSFIDFSVKNFPAEKLALIMWDHGGGSIAGYGHDENFNKSNLTLLDMNYAFKNSALSGQKLELLGFDSCLMATAEMALIASSYANYLVASEDLEPGDGWDYSFLSAINEKPDMSGAELGKEIVDSFFDFYGEGSEEILTLSVTDLSKMEHLAGSVDRLMAKCVETLSQDKRTGFNTLARRRSYTKTFGEGSPRDNDCDMVDIGDMAARLYDLYPDEAAGVMQRLDEAVIYNRHNSDADIRGLSLYYVFGGKKNGREALELYNDLETSGEHTGYLMDFFRMLTSGRTIGRTRSASAGFTSDEVVSSHPALWRRLEGGSEFILVGIQNEIALSPDELISTDTLWPKINGHNVPMYKVNETADGVTFSIPSQVNGKRCDIVVLINSRHNRGKILGIRNEDGLIIQKGYDDIEDGDVIAFYYEVRGFPEHDGESRWFLSEEFEVAGELTVEWEKLDKETDYTGFIITDIRGYRHFTEPVSR